MKQSSHESTFYLVLWTILFIVPVIVFRIWTINDNENFEWNDIWHIWKQFILFLGFFLFHNYVLAPLLLKRQKRWIYCAGVVALLMLFITIQHITRPQIPKDHPIELTGQRPPQDDRMGPPDRKMLPPEGEMAPPEGEMAPPEGEMAPPEGEMAPPEGEMLPPEGEMLQTDSRQQSQHEFKEHHPPAKPHFIVGQHDIIATIILMLMLGMNIGVKVYFRHREDEQRMADLERKNLEQQLEYLKYQINPHFLMNTLNNIHALVDIEPEQAKESIVELSKILRFVLYEGSKQKVPLNRELAFLEDYIQLMRMRLTDSIKLSVTMPERIPDAEIPPLLLITFVENAFKHGVSYQHPSFIDIRIEADADRLSFYCRNSKVPQTEDKHGGVGLKNARQRLDLIYGKAYTLDIQDAPDTYTVELIININDKSISN